MRGFLCAAAASESLTKNPTGEPGGLAELLSDFGEGLNMHFLGHFRGLFKIYVIRIEV